MATFFGIDLHKRSLFISAVDEKGNILLSKNFLNKKGFLSIIPSFPKPYSFAIESTRAFLPLYWNLQNFGNTYVLNPGKISFIYKNKNDKNDSLKLANIIRTDFIKPSYIPETFFKGRR